ncbi:amino acid ABC transporter substrate-binding protein [Clostridium amazonitimonense]|uniref:amino acid ABC transporter substrate-binding protein n=1 Tax=Clostridium amazonitimonense TaxID=1499689 RepID=UPI000509BA8E|nr:amino acid ABC transporter substrate-binding protein [Clostridium amazonitimonense]
MRNKYLSFIVAMLGVFLLSGCNNGKTSLDEFENIKKRGYIILGLDDTFVPMGFKDASGEVVGFDIDIAKELGRRLNLEVKFQPIDWAMKETELKNKNIDVIWNGYSITEERKEKVEFSDPYVENRQVIITLKDSNINKKSDLEGKKVAVQSGSSALDAINKEEELMKKFQNGKPITFDTNNEALMDLESSRVDAVVADEILSRYYTTQRGSEKYKVLSEDFGKEQYGIGMRKGDKKFIEEINSILNNMKRDGTTSKISSKWFGEDIIK